MYEQPTHAIVGKNKFLTHILTQCIYIYIHTYIHTYNLDVPGKSKRLRHALPCEREPAHTWDNAWRPFYLTSPIWYACMHACMCICIYIVRCLHTWTAYVHVHMHVCI